jgi:low affinity Fe/Cu permease
MDQFFARFATATAHATGSPITFILCVAAVLLWAVSGPLFGFSETWQLVINTGTTIVTFLMVFLIQNTQNREGAAVQLKLDELIRAVDGAHNVLLDLEELTERELDRFKDRYQQIAGSARNDLRRGVADTGTPEIQVADTAEST